MTTTLEAIDLPFTQAIDFFRQKTRMPSEHWTDVWRDAHSRAFMVAGAASDALLEDFQKAVQKALSSGTTLAEFRRDFDAIVERHGWTHTGEAGWRAQIIYETNLATAYSAGRFAQMTDPDVLRAYPFWQYRHTACRHPRLMHLAWDGLTLRADDPWWDAHYPPNGWRCGCRVQPVSERGLKRMGKSAPDPSPPTVTQPWTNRKTGEVHEVPVGVDPGFDYNMGRAWRAPVHAPELRPATAETPAAAREPLQPHDFGSTLEAHEALLRAYTPWAEGLTPEERAALALYKGALGRRLNEDLRTPTGDPLLGEMVGLLSGALARADAPMTLRLWRGASPSEVALYRARDKGARVSVPAFTSTTIDREVAAKLGTVVEILVPAGMKGVAYIHPFPRYRFRQYEVLLSNGVTFRVVEADAARIVLEALHAGGE